MADLYLALGSNIVPRRHLPQALTLLHARYRLLRVSSWYLTRPWGVTDQPWFLNCAVHAVTCDDPHQVLVFTQRIEALLGRRRVLTNGPRTVDIDLLLHDNHVCCNARLTLPHPGLRERDFMLIPLLELAPHTRHPGDGTPLAAAVGTLRYRQIVHRVAAQRAGWRFAARRRSVALRTPVGHISGRAVFQRSVPRGRRGSPAPPAAEPPGRGD